MVILRAYQLTVFIALTMAASLAFAQSWLALAIGALTYEVSSEDAATNVVIANGHAYVALGEAGMAQMDLQTRSTVTIAPAKELGSIDDIAVAGDLLFALDGRAPGGLAVYQLHEASQPELRSIASDVPVEPFVGVAAVDGVVIVSGGTKQLTVRQYDSDGLLSEVTAELDVGRGQPDIFLADDGTHAVVSTHTFGKDFGVTVVEVNADTGEVSVLESIGLTEAGFTPGGMKPANFPIEVAQVEQWLLVANGGGVAVIDVSDWQAPVLVNEVDIGMRAVNIDIHDYVAAVVGHSDANELILLDVAELPEVRVLERIPLPEEASATGVAFNDDVIVVAQQAAGYHIIERHNQTTLSK